MENLIYQSEYGKEELIRLLNTIEAKVKEIKRLIEKATYCDDVISQISDIQSDFNRVRKQLLACHFHKSVVERLQEGDMNVIEEVLITIQKLVK
ncbi:metal-sensing transcriptional repressor [Bacillus sp. CGMCC 1.16607]|uniref:metal-sensing transcriptional repressor n=1 Tax=Bacillus sp. CGMCC 1.16607 TaxID=3351842 RepID=UPI00363A5DD8